MTSVIGLDIGQYSSKIACARNRGIDIIVNEVSNRATPTLVGFGPKNRAIGESAKTMEVSNYKNTVGSLKRVVGHKFGDEDVQNELRYLTSEVVDVQGSVGFKVQHLGEEQTFTATQVYAMFLAKLKSIAANETKAAVNDVVIAVPVWYTEAQRRATLEAAEVAGLNCLRLINDTTAIALGYGITKSDLPALEEPSRNVVFVDIGHSDYTVSVVSFSKGQLSVRASDYDRNFGGRNIDAALVDHFCAEFQDKYKIDIKSSPKAMFRLAAAVEKMKKILSANPLAPISVESVMNDVDASSSMKRETLEELIAPLLERTTAPLERALAASGLTKSDIHSIELIGGCTRVPAVKSRIEQFFGLPLSFTCNQEEAVVRGATFACAMLSPVFRVRDFKVTDYNMHPIKLMWDQVPGEDESEFVAFDRGNAVPSTKVLSFARDGPFTIQAEYAAPIHGTNPWIGQFNVKSVGSAGRKVVKIKTKLNMSGVLVFDNATVFEDDPATAAEEAAPVEEGAEPKPKKVIRTELPTVSAGLGKDQAVLESYRETEGGLYAIDKLVHETEEAQNMLEEYVYEVRDKMDGAWKKFIRPEEKEALSKLALEMEDWLYTDEGESANKSAYNERLGQMQAIGAPVSERYRDYEARPAASSRLRELMATYMGQAQDEAYAYIGADDLNKVVECCANTEAWLGNKLASQAEKALSDKPSVSVRDIEERINEVRRVCAPIMGRPKPKVSNSTQEEAPKEEKKEPEAPQPEEMDIDQMD